jgi:hypothetical protein
MADLHTFELRLQDAFDRYLEGAPTRVDAGAMAATAVAGGRPAPGLELRWRLPAFARIALVAIALLLTIAIAILGGGANNLFPNLTTASATPSSSPPPTAAATDGLTDSTFVGGAPAWDAVVLRVDPTDASLIDVVLVRPNGQERVIRQVSTTLPDFEMPLSTYGSASEDGWLAIGSDSQPGQLPYAAYQVLNLADPTFDPMTVLYPPVMGGRWSSTGLFALSTAKNKSGTSWMNIDIINPRIGQTVELGKIGLFGGGPSIVWASDGSGIWNQGRLRPADGSASIPIDPELTFSDRRIGKGGTHLSTCAWDSAEIICDGQPDTVALVHSDGSSEAWYSNPNPDEHITGAWFAADGTAVLVTLDRLAGTVHQVILLRVDGPGVITQLLAFDLQDVALDPQIAAITPDDQTVAFFWSTGEQLDPLPVSPLLGLDGSVGAFHPVGFVDWVPGPIAESWPVSQ